MQLLNATYVKTSCQIEQCCACFVFVELLLLISLAHFCFDAEAVRSWNLRFARAREVFQWPSAEDLKVHHPLSLHSNIVHPSSKVPSIPATLVIMVVLCVDSDICY